MEEKAKELSIVAVISILTIVLAISVGVAQASEWQETHPNASSGTLYEPVSGMVGEGSKVSNASPDRDSKVIYGQNLSATIPKQVVLTERDNGSSISVYKGQELVIELNSNPSTGYRWEVVESNENILRFMGMEFGEPETNLFGAPQKQIIRFEVNDTGICSPKLVYQRPWEQTPEDYYMIRVNSSLPSAHIQHTLEEAKAKAKGGLTASTNRSEYSARFARLELTKEGPKVYIGPEARIKPVKQTKEKFQNTRSWSTIMTEDFEGVFPGEKWAVFYNETEPLPATWDKTNYRNHSGEYSVHCAASIIETPPYSYVPNMNAWMVYGPFNLSEARDAELFFNHWTRTAGIPDYLFVGASVDGIAFYGVTYSGHWNEYCGGNGWCPGNFDLTDVYTLGNLCGYKKVWIAFAFISDSDNSNDDGAYLDDIVLRKDTGEICPGLPSRFDWRDSGGVTPIKDQGHCGSCWAFATVGPLEANIKIKDDTTTDLSEQFLISCNVETPEPWSCTGGLFAHDYHWNKVTASGEAGAVAESEKPYNAADEPCCSILTPCPFNHSWKLTSWSCVAGDATPPDCCRCNGQIVSTCDIKRAIMRYGPVSAAVCVREHFLNYRGGVFETDEFCPDGLNHAIVLTGWDDTQGNNGVWFLRNSWGPYWGESGYMRIGYGISAVGSCANYIVYQGKGDEIGVRESNVFYLDYNGNGTWDGCTVDKCYWFGGSTATPITGDWDGDGVDEIGVRESNVFYLDYNGNGYWDGGDKLYAFGSPTATPITGDWDGDGVDEVGVRESNVFYLDYNGNGVWDGCTVDKCYWFGGSTATPITGNWDGL